MKSAATGTASGCVVWTLVFCVLSTCLLSAGLPVAGILTSINEDLMVSVMGPIICPADSTGEIVTHPTTGTDSSGHTIQMTAYEMQCVDANGVVVQEPSPDYAFQFIGIVAVIGLVLAALFAFLLAAPAGVLVSSLINRWRGRSARG